MHLNKMLLENALRTDASKLVKPMSLMLLSMGISRGFRSCNPMEIWYITSLSGIKGTLDKIFTFYF